VQQLIAQQQPNTQQQQQQQQMSFQQVGPHNVAWPEHGIAQPSQMLMQVSTDGQAVQQPIAQQQMALQRTNRQQVGTSNHTSAMARTETRTATQASCYADV
jgi:aspartate oxidase